MFQGLAKRLLPELQHRGLTAGQQKSAQQHVIALLNRLLEPRYVPRITAEQEVRTLLADLQGGAEDIRRMLGGTAERNSAWRCVAWLAWLSAPARQSDLQTPRSDPIEAAAVRDLITAIGEYGSEFDEDPASARDMAEICLAAFPRLRTAERERLLIMLLDEESTESQLLHVLLARFYCDQADSLEHNDRVPGAEQPSGRRVKDETYKTARFHAVASLERPPSSVRETVAAFAVLIRVAAAAQFVDEATDWFARGLRSRAGSPELTRTWLAAVMSLNDGRLVVEQFLRDSTDLAELTSDQSIQTILCLHQLGGRDLSHTLRHLKSLEQSIEHLVRDLKRSRPGALQRWRIADSLSLWTAMAVASHDVKLARRVFEWRPDSPDEFWFDHYGLDSPDICRRRVMALAGPGADYAGRIESALSSHDCLTPATVSELTEVCGLLRNADGATSTQEYCQWVERQLSFHTELSAGGKIDLLTSAYGGLWRATSPLEVNEGVVSLPRNFDRTGMLQFRPSLSPGIRVSLRLRLNGPGELSLHFDSAASRSNEGTSDSVYLTGNFEGLSGTHSASHAGPLPVTLLADNRIEVILTTETIMLTVNERQLPPIARTTTDCFQWSLHPGCRAGGQLSLVVVERLTEADPTY